MPILQGSGDYDVEVVGESHYQQHLVRIAGKHTPDGRRVECPATLFLEKNNAYDPNAIRVEIDGEPVGYIPREFAHEMRTALKQIGIVDGQRVGVDAIIVGGRTGQSYGVWLDIDLGDAYYDAEDEDEDDEDAEGDKPAHAVTQAPARASAPPAPPQPAPSSSGGSVLVAGLLVLVTLLALGLVLVYALR